MHLPRLLRQDLPGKWFFDETENLDYAYLLLYLKSGAADQVIGKTYDYIYDELSVIDRKVGGQLSFSSLLAVIFTLFMSQSTNNGISPSWAAVGLLIEFAAAVIVLFGIWIRWLPPLKDGEMRIKPKKYFDDIRKVLQDREDFLQEPGMHYYKKREKNRFIRHIEEKYPLPDGGAYLSESIDEFEEKVKGLMRTRNARTVFYRLSFCMSIFGVFYAVGLVVVGFLLPQEAQRSVNEFVCDHWFLIGDCVPPAVIMSN